MYETVKMAIVLNRWYNIAEIPNPSEALQIAAVKEYGCAIEYTENPSEAVQLAAVNSDAIAIMHIDDPSETVQLAAVSRNGQAIHYIEDPTKIVEVAAKKQSEEEQKRRDKELVYFELFRTTKHPSEALQMNLVRCTGSAIYHLANPSEAVQLAAVKQDPSVLYFIEDPSEAVQIEAVKNYGYAITMTKSPSETVQLIAVRNNHSAVQHIKYPSEAVQLAAVHANSLCVIDIQNPCFKIYVIYYLYKFDTDFEGHVSFEVPDKIQKKIKAMRLRRFNIESIEGQHAFVNEFPGLVECILNPFGSTITKAIEKNPFNIGKFENLQQYHILIFINKVCHF